jgi:hypothetical protein
VTYLIRFNRSRCSLLHGGFVSLCMRVSVLLFFQISSFCLLGFNNFCCINQLASEYCELQKESLLEFIKTSVAYLLAGFKC